MAWAITPESLSLAATRLYAQVEHLETEGEAEGYPWAVACAALCAPIDDLYDLLFGADAPWAALLDPDLAAETLTPEFAERLLPYVGQFIGVTYRAGVPLAGQRLRLSETGGAKVGSPAAILGAARQRLIGPDGTPESATVLLLERVGGDPYHFAVTVQRSHVPDELIVMDGLEETAPAIARDIDEQTPAGRRGTDPETRFDLNIVEGGDYETLAASFASYDDVAAEFSTYDELAANPSGV